MSDELSRLRAENARLRALLAQHGITIDEHAPSPSHRSAAKSTSTAPTSMPSYENIELTHGSKIL